MVYNLPLSLSSNFPGGVPESEEGGEREGVMRTRKRSREDLDTQSVDLHFTVSPSPPSLPTSLPHLPPLSNLIPKISVVMTSC